MAMQLGWFARQSRSVADEVARWPEWMKRAAGLEDTEMPDTNPNMPPPPFCSVVCENGYSAGAFGFPTWRDAMNHASQMNLDCPFAASWVYQLANDPPPAPAPPTVCCCECAGEFPPAEIPDGEVFCVRCRAIDLLQTLYRRQAVVASHAQMVERFLKSVGRGVRQG